MPRAKVFWFGTKLEAELREAAKDALRATALNGIGDIQESMRTTETTPSKRAKTGRVSRPGSPPAVQTGTLLGAIDLDDSDLSDLVIRVGVTSVAPYGVYLEHGTAKMAGRPFLEPAEKRMKEELEEALNAKIKEVLT